MLHEFYFYFPFEINKIMLEEFAESSNSNCCCNPPWADGIPAQRYASSHSICGNCASSWFAVASFASTLICATTWRMRNTHLLELRPDGKATQNDFVQRFMLNVMWLPLTGGGHWTLESSATVQVLLARGGRERSRKRVLLAGVVRLLTCCKFENSPATATGYKESCMLAQSKRFLQLFCVRVCPTN